MNAQQVRAITLAQLSNGSISNAHGITNGNINDCLIEPHAIEVDPDELERISVEMWAVLRTPGHEYLVVFDPSTSMWGVAEEASAGKYLLVVSADSLQGALEGM